jgi:hypothetical protein
MNEKGTQPTSRKVAHVKIYLWIQTCSGKRRLPVLPHRVTFDERNDGHDAIPDDEDSQHSPEYPAEPLGANDEQACEQRYDGYLGNHKRP